VSDFRAADETHPSATDGYLQSAGIAQWLAGRESEAASTWHNLVIAHERCKIQYTDGAGGVGSPCILWFAAVRLGRPDLLEAARRLLRVKTGPKNGWINNWPGPIAKFLLGRIDEARLRAQVEPDDERGLCQAEFYIGVRRLEIGDYAGAKKAFRAAAKLTKANIEDEYYLAVHESKRRLPAAGEKVTHARQYRGSAV
jgi:hypothetical protein